MPIKKQRMQLLGFEAKTCHGSSALRYDLFVILSSDYGDLEYLLSQFRSHILIFLNPPRPELVGPESSPTSTNHLLPLKKLEKSSQTPLLRVRYQVLQGARLRRKPVSVVSPVPPVIGGMDVDVLRKADKVSYQPV